MPLEVVSCPSCVELSTHSIDLIYHLTKAWSPQLVEISEFVSVLYCEAVDFEVGL